LAQLAAASSATWTEAAPMPVEVDPVRAAAPRIESIYKNIVPCVPVSTGEHFRFLFPFAPLFLNLSMWVVKYGCASLLQSLNTHIAGVRSTAAARTPKNQRKKGGKFRARFAPHAKHGANSWKTARLFVRFLQLSGREPR
jgi:hypothetical protein